VQLIGGAAVFASTATPPMDLYLRSFHFCSLFVSAIATAILFPTLGPQDQIIQ
jgi:hypothetical protein